jgi:hypothetical protein
MNLEMAAAVDIRYWYALQMEHGGKCPNCGKEAQDGWNSFPHCSTSFSPANASKKEFDEARNEAARIERDRVIEINAICSKAGLGSDVVNELITCGKPIEDCRKILLDKITSKTPDPITPHVSVGADEKDKFRDIAGKSILNATGQDRSRETTEVLAKVDKAIKPRNFSALINSCLFMEGKLSERQILALDPNDRYEQAIRMASTTSSDLSAILADTQNKVLGKAFVETPASFESWCNEMEVPDFKTMSIPKLSTIGDLETLPEGANMKETRITDKKETGAVTTKAKTLTITRQAIINDDLNALVVLPNALAAAAKRGINKDVYDRLCLNSLTGPTMTETSAVMFSSSNANLKTSSGVPSVSSLSVAEGMLNMLTGPTSEKNQTPPYLNLTGRYLLA